MDNDRYLREIHRQVGNVAVNAVWRMNEQQAAQNRQLIQGISKRVADIYKAPIEGMRASQAQLAGRLYDGMVKSVNVQAFTAVNRIAAQAIASSFQAQVRTIDLINRQQLDDIISRAVRLSSSPHTQELLRRANEVAEAIPPAAAQDAEASLTDMPDLPQMQWVFMLDRESLVFLVRVLFHLTGVLSPALGVAVAMSDREIDTEDLGALVGALYVMLAYALLALREKGGD